MAHWTPSLLTTVGKMAQEKKIHYFTPSLTSILRRAELRKGSALTEAEVLEIKDNSTAIAVTPEIAREMDEKRGHRDIDPDNCWVEWQALRKTFGED